ncbi:hypothetical protein G4228_019622 [Cervus hanglu yarkandensis]|uniref:Uncharacterized protein n=1 Tax=Cervus hanglu yarkandensis TaxID=84702 RepID=A0A833WGD0_9CERV|nr:hypothetical protein G4228_019622 [Cervus hanglu yarkandensis]
MLSLCLRVSKWCCGPLPFSGHQRSEETLNLEVKDNRYFWNTVIIKEYYLDIPGKRGFQGGLGHRVGWGVFSPGKQNLFERTSVGNLQPPGGIPGEEVTLYTVEAVEDSGALVNGEEAEIRWECQLLAEDIMEEVEVVADKEQEQQSSQELEEKTVEEQGLKRHGGLSEQPVLDVLQSLAALQMELRSEHEKNHWAYVSFMLKNHHSRKCHLAWRSAIIQGIADFWINADVDTRATKVTF